MVDALEKEGVKHVFGIPGNPHALYDSLYDSGIEPILVRHEASGAFMAFAYSKLTREPGVCFGSPGPGVTNLISGVLEAWSGCQPMIALGGSADTVHEGMGAFQETPQMQMMRPITKWSYRVPLPGKAAWAMSRAFSLTCNGRPGPVYIDVPFDIGVAETDETGYTPSIRPIRSRPSLESVKDAADLLLSSEKPVIVAGGGAFLSGAGPSLVALAEMLGVPVLTTPSGRGCISESHPLAAGLVGLYRTKIGKRLMAEADLLLTVGSRNEEFQTATWSHYPGEAKYIQIDVDADEVGRNWVPDVPVVGDARLSLLDLIKVLGEKVKSRPMEEMPRVKSVIEAKKQFLADVDAEVMSEKPVKSKRVVYETNRVFGGGTVLVNENGSQDLWSYYYPYYRVLDYDCCVAPAEQTCMGLGVAGAIGAKLAVPDRKVICTTGDGAFQMGMKELPTAVQYGTPVTWIVLNNFSLGWIKLHQWANEERYISVDYEAQPDFAKIAEACGCHGEQVTTVNEIKSSLERALKKNREGVPAVLDYVVESVDFPDGFKEFHPQIFRT
ncbi:thiamine pyrophosphate-binding protein [Candidatus Bathyarchaeota archaeon]|nr:thiamine pyrophosphate-binding protein [Candidatus Bathyarchaeota archaeon]